MLRVTGFLFAPTTATSTMVTKSYENSLVGNWLSIQVDGNNSQVTLKVTVANNSKNLLFERLVLQIDIII